MVRWLLEQGANVESPTVLGYTPLHQAAQQGHCLVITLLLHARAKPDAVTHVSLQFLSCFILFVRLNSNFWLTPISFFIQNNLIQYATFIQLAHVSHLFH